MPSLFEPNDVRSIHQRVDRLASNSARQWGKMTAPEMLCHITDGLRIPLGEIPASSKGWNPFRLKPLRWLLVFVLPWPKGKVPTTPDFQQAKPTSWDSDRAAFHAALDRFAARGEQGERFRAHPTFGNLANEEWARLAYRHVDHHLTQFGV